MDDHRAVVMAGYPPAVVAVFPPVSPVIHTSRGLGDHIQTVETSALLLYQMAMASDPFAESSRPKSCGMPPSVLGGRSKRSVYVM